MLCKACRILLIVPQLGIEPTPPAVEEKRSLNHWTSRKVPVLKNILLKNF